jgi:hypothetical protein
VSARAILRTASFTPFFTDTTIPTGRRSRVRNVEWNGPPTTAEDETIVLECRYSSRAAPEWRVAGGRPPRSRTAPTLSFRRHRADNAKPRTSRRADPARLHHRERPPPLNRSAQQIFRAIHFLPSTTRIRKWKRPHRGRKRAQDPRRGSPVDGYVSHEMPIPDKRSLRARMPSWPAHAMRAVRRERPGARTTYPPPPVAGRLLEQHSPHPRGRCDSPPSELRVRRRRRPHRAHGQEALRDRLRKREHERELRVDARERAACLATRPDRWN